jgi:hypothetical protein
MASIVLPAPARPVAPMLLAHRLVGRVFGRVRRTVYTHCQNTRTEMLGQFESLGDNCEFASLQKAYGVNTAAMFRWSDTSVDMLVEALGNDLAGGDDIANLEVLPEHDGEYLLHHRLYRSTSHTFAMVSRDDPALVLKREQRRLILLRRKFLEDVRAGRRTYVFRSLNPVSPDQAGALNEALRRKGPNRLLWVRQAASPDRAGRVTQSRDGLLTADIAVLAPYSDGIRFSSRAWLPALRRAQALIAADRPAERLEDSVIHESRSHRSLAA